MKRDDAFEAALQLGRICLSVNEVLISLERRGEEKLY